MKTLLITTAIVVALTASASAQFFRPGGGNFGGPIPNPCAKGSYYQNSSGKCVPEPADWRRRPVRAKPRR
jgi:hypothetical protein